MIVIQCATPDEFIAWKKAVGASSIEREKSLRCFSWRSRIDDMIVFEGGLGQTRPAAACVKALQIWSPKLVVDFGAAGALDTELKVGDVLIADRVVECFGERCHSNDGVAVQWHDDFPASGDIPQFPSFKSLGRGRATQGVLAAGKVVADKPEGRKALARATGAVAVCWEAFAIARACQAAGTGFMSARVITDIGVAPVLDEYKANVREVLDQTATELARLWRA